MFLLSSKIKISNSGIMEGYTDFHCHLLPGVDDGVQKIDESIGILDLWEKAGVRKVWLTPHIMEDMPNKPDILREKFDTFKTAYGKGIELCLSSENMIDSLMAERLKTADLLPLGDKGKYLLVETSYVNPPIDMDGIIMKVKSLGFIPILAHPERYRYMEMSDYEGWKSKGLLFQMNLPSLTGVYGNLAKQKSEILLTKGMYDLFGTDTHSLRTAEFLLNAKIPKKFAALIKELRFNY